MSCLRGLGVLQLAGRDDELAGLEPGANQRARLDRFAGASASV